MFSLAVFSAVLVAVINGQSPSIVFVGFRHANRNPGAFLPDDPNKGKWGLEGDSQLTEIGKKQAYGLGKLLRKTYGALLSEQWVPSEIESTSSSAERCQMTLQCALAGLYPPKDYSLWNKDIPWQPIPYKIDDEMLRTYATKCPTSDSVWKPVDNGVTEPGKSLLAKYPEIVKFASEKTGWPATLGKMGDLADNIEQMHSRHLKLPDWVTGNNPFKRDISHELIEFAEVPQIGCAVNDACRKMMSGYWYDKVLKIMDEKQSKGAKFTKKMFLFATHNEIASSMMQLFGVKQNGLPYNGAFILEYSDSPKRQLRMFYSKPSEKDPYQRDTEVVKLCSSGEWCDLATVINATARIDNWKGACGINDCAAGK